ncbi:MAG: hypothetical protein EKK68_14725 [Candidatus Competibacteraceae bacterium]|nr:MAG: hypothetical protein EKK68_14725 [Candidatus Competibacteraceae bacterium]
MKGNKDWAVAVLLMTSFAAPVLAANKCIDAGGRVIYQDAPCPVTTHGGDMTLNVNRPVTGQAKSPELTGTAPITGQVLLPDQDSPTDHAAPSSSGAER